MFTEDGQGSWMVMFLTSLFSLFIFSFAYNGFLMLEGKHYRIYSNKRRPRLKSAAPPMFSPLIFSLSVFVTAWISLVILDLL